MMTITLRRTLRSIRVAVCVALLSSLPATGKSTESILQGNPAPRAPSAGREATEARDPDRIVIPVRIVGDADDAARTQEREDRAEKRESDDLVAQQRAAQAAERSADASERQVVAAVWQTWLTALSSLVTVIGTIILLYTLSLTRASVRLARQSANAAIQAVRVAADTAEKELRAYLYIFPVSMILVKPNEHLIVSLSIKNHGVTPLTNGIFNYGLDICALRSDNDYRIRDELQVSTSSPIILAGNASPSPFQLISKQRITEEEFGQVERGESVVVVSGKMKYNDVFEKERMTGFSYSFSWDQISKVRDMLIKDGYVGGAGPANYNKTGNFVV